MKTSVELVNNVKYDFFKNMSKLQRINYLKDNEIDIDLIRACKGIIPWSHLSYMKKLSDDFIIEFQYYVDWYYICLEQDISENVIDKCQHHFSKIHWQTLFHNNSFTNEMRLKYFNKQFT